MPADPPPGNGIARPRGTTPTVALIAAVGALLSRLKGDGREVSVATASAGRPEPEHSELVGCFAGVLPLRLPSPPSQLFSALVEATQRALSGALLHEGYPLRLIMQDLAQARGGDVKCVGLPPTIQQVANLIAMGDVMECYDDLHQALRSFRSSPAAAW